MNQKRRAEGAIDEGYNEIDGDQRGDEDDVLLILEIAVMLIEIMWKAFKNS
jgi:hypothetical protein